ncbi:MAG: hypothetical protein JSR27_10405 [Proteobacteria bacterium]|nr:hypothetical protein [Pseudomonadota bacterium]
MTVVFYRILGNDIPVRHGPYQTLRSLSFTLENEPALPGCKKRFLLNRIADSRIRDRLVAMIEHAGHRWDEIAFDPGVYRQLVTSEERALYLTNQNAARNLCIDLGLSDGEVVLPFDGQVFFSVEGWSGLMDALATDAISKFLIVPMFRLRSNQHALASKPKPGEDDNHLWAEPQIAVRAGADVRFNERLNYGRANKVEMLMRLGVAGPWDGWSGDHIRAIRANLADTRSRDFGRVPEAGFVLRLESGNWKADRNISFRVQTRQSGLDEFIARVDWAYRLRPLVQA